MWPRVSTLTVLAVVACSGGDASATRSDSTPTASVVAASAPPDTALAPGMVSAGSTPVFSLAQATRGEAAWAQSCGRCHALSQLSGSAFDAGWNHRKLSQLFERVKTTMPQDDPGSLTDEQYIDIVAYVLRVNGLPAGKTPLSPEAEALRKIRIDVPVHIPSP